MSLRFPFHSNSSSSSATYQPTNPLSHPPDSEHLQSYEQHLSSVNSTQLSEADRSLCEEFISTLSPADGCTPDTPLSLTSLLTSSTPRSFHVGTGLSVTTLLSSIIASATTEVLFVTCFWAASESRAVFADALRTLSDTALAKGKGRIRVRIGFSSSGLLQKLRHPSTPKGKEYPPSTWASMGLPDPRELEGLDMAVKSIFYLPFSVLHGKFCIVDRKVLVLPSANISYEVWGESATIFEGAVVDTFLQFWRGVWGIGEEARIEDDEEEDLLLMGDSYKGRHGIEDLTPIAAPVRMHEFSTNPALTHPTLFLPQPHHRHPRFPAPISHFLPAPPAHKDPMGTPQNAFLLLAVAKAQKSIYIQTPNLTSQPLIDALAAAVRRGVVVELVTCRRMMTLEQVVTTAGAGITEWCVRRLVKRVVANALPEGKRGAGGGGGRGLWVWYYTGAAKEVGGGGLMDRAVKSHVKAMIIDGRITVVGSANADRASWYTSQEVNVAVFAEGFAKEVRRELVQGLGGRLESVFRGREDGNPGVGVEARIGRETV
ncbi:uncharacterized protein LAJ45_08057 [Morchella importuna]|nr:uncharacterized protein LAJ45_08057 [Morchella importuna]KAH8147956.1 hypothetical protein LAJ45_08057 [Morchella importuna]